MYDPVEVHLTAAGVEFETLKFMEALADDQDDSAANETRALLEDCFTGHLAALAEIAGIEVSEFIEATDDERHEAG